MFLAAQLVYYISGIVYGNTMRKRNALGLSIAGKLFIGKI
jgi:hypothetical protein